MRNGARALRSSTLFDPCSRFSDPLPQISLLNVFRPSSVEARRSSPSSSLFSDTVRGLNLAKTFARHANEIKLASGFVNAEKMRSEFDSIYSCSYGMNEDLSELCETNPDRFHNLIQRLNSRLSRDGRQPGFGNLGAKVNTLRIQLSAGARSYVSGSTLVARRNRAAASTPRVLTIEGRVSFHYLV